MKYACGVAFFFGVAFMLLASCTTVPITGRNQVRLVPRQTMLATSFQQYDQFLEENDVSERPQKVRLVKNVGTRVQHAVEEYFRSKGQSDKLDGYEWSFNLVESDEVNAWCMPGGKVVVYGGILPVVQDEAGLAVVVAHEVAHAVAGHGNERMSHALLTQLGQTALSKALESKPEQTRQLWMAAVGTGAQLGVMLPYSRLHEYEADRLGLIFMALAGYDPREAIPFWQRMRDKKEGASPPPFLSTHPTDQSRIDRIRELLPEAMSYYKGRH